MTRNELLKTRCWSCWWREGFKCYSEDLGEIKEEDGLRIGHLISQELIERCENYYNKRKALSSVIPNDKLIIVSEDSKKENDICEANYTDCGGQ